MNYYLDTEFLEGKQKVYKKDGFHIISSLILFCIILYICYYEKDNYIRNSIIMFIFIVLDIYRYFKDYYITDNTIDLISIGIVSEDGREYYTISKDFNLREAWDRWQIKTIWENGIGKQEKEYWIRENVLKSIFNDFIEKEFKFRNKQQRILGYSDKINYKFTYKNFKRLLKKYGKSNKDIAKEVVNFTLYVRTNVDTPNGKQYSKPLWEDDDLQFYAYYADYDWVVFCWLFGRMIDLPKGFPKYCNDLKQIFEDKVKKKHQYSISNHENPQTKQEVKDMIKSSNFYPVQDYFKQHNALEDARWNKDFHKFLNSI